MDRLTQIESLLIRDLRALVTLAERKHFAHAADEVGLSQPTLSALVKRLEGIYGVTLFARTSRSFAITPEGEAVIRQARVVLEELSRLANALDDQDALLTGRFRIGVIPTLASYYIPSFLPALTATYPRLELVLVEAKTDVLLHQLRHREVDAALLALPTEDPEMQEMPLFREPFALAVPVGHPLAERAEVTTQEVDLRELLLLEPGNCLRDQTLDACGTRRPGDVRPVHATSLETLRYMVATRVGIGVLPRLATVERHIPNLAVRYIPFTPPGPSRVIGLVSQRHGRHRRDLAAMAECLCAELPPEVSAL